MMPRFVRVVLVTELTGPTVSCGDLFKISKLTRKQRQKLKRNLRRANASGTDRSTTVPPNHDPKT